MIFILLYFLLGIAFIQWVLPLLDEMFSIIATALELLKGKMSIKIAEYKNQIQKITDDNEEVSARVIGFTVPSDDDYYEEDDEEE